VSIAIGAALIGTVGYQLLLIVAALVLGVAAVPILVRIRPVMAVWPG
jgi:hypothetical protein